MSDFYQLQNITNKTLKSISDKLCCINTNLGGSDGYNNLGQINIASAGTASKTFAIGAAHAITFDVVSGAVTIAIDGGAAVSYAKGFDLEFTTTNAQSIVFTSTSGNTNIDWVY